MLLGATRPSSPRVVYYKFVRLLGLSQRRREVDFQDTAEHRAPEPHEVAPCGSLRGTPSRLPGVVKRTLRPRNPRRFGWCVLIRFRTAARYAPTRSRAAAQITGQPRRSWTVEWGNAVHVHEPSGISVRILVEGSLWGSSSYETGGPYGPALRTIPRLRSEPHARMTESQHAHLCLRGGHHTAG